MVVLNLQFTGSHAHGLLPVPQWRQRGGGISTDLPELKDSPNIRSLNSLHCCQVGSMLKQIDTKDDLEVLAKFLFGVVVNCCLFNEIPRWLNVYYFQLRCWVAIWGGLTLPLSLTMRWRFFLLHTILHWSWRWGGVLFFFHTISRWTMAVPSKMLRRQ